MKKANFVFIGASRFGLRCLEKLMLVKNIRVVGVVTAKEVFNISYSTKSIKNYLHVNFEKNMRMKSIPVATLNNKMIEPELYDTVTAWKPDAFLVAGWYHMIPNKWLEFAPAYGLHASLLPKYSGGAPLVWAMINGEKKTGITLFKMDSGVDAGPILGQMDTEISEKDTIKTLYERIEELGLKLIEKNLPLIADGKERMYKQDDQQRTIVPQRNPEDGLINWNWDCTFIDRWIRAQTKPYPGAFTFYKKKKIFVWNARIHSYDTRGSVGNIFFNKGCSDPIVNCGKGSLFLDYVSYENDETIIINDTISFD
jgi:methionyl-tRNA formyltransferase